MLRKLKDKALAEGLIVAANNYMEGWGRLLDLEFDSGRKRIAALLALERELEPLRVEVGSYRLVEEGERSYLELSDISTSREWINTIALRHLEGRRFVIPSRYATMVKMLA